MTTIKQLEALVAFAECGSVDAAARRLGVVHSAVSRQIREFEEGFGFPLLDREGRSARLSVEGTEVLSRAKAVLRQRDVLLERIVSKEILVRKLRLGVTELTALTWLPRLLEAIRAEYPQVVIEPEVDHSAHLRDRLQAGHIDMAILPDAFGASGYVKDTLADVQNEWYCSPILVSPNAKLSLPELCEYTILTQGELSGSGVLIGEWLRKSAALPRMTITCNSVIALVGLAAAGQGITYLPLSVIANLVESGQLVALDVTPRMPPLRYVTMIRSDVATPFLRNIVAIARKTCDFEGSYQVFNGARETATGGSAS